MESVFYLLEFFLEFLSQNWWTFEKFLHENSAFVTISFLQYLDENEEYIPEEGQRMNQLKCGNKKKKAAIRINLTVTKTLEITRILGKNKKNVWRGIGLIRLSYPRDILCCRTYGAPMILLWYQNYRIQCQALMRKES